MKPFGILNIYLSILCFGVIAVHGAIPSGYVKYYNSEFYFSPDLVSWQEAHQQCVALGYNLHVPSPLIETSFVLKTLGPDWVQWWVGVNDNEVEGQYKDIHGNLVTYTDWFKGIPATLFNKQPTAMAGENCIEIRRHYHDTSGVNMDWGKHYWNDCICDLPRHFICERKICGFSPTEAVECSSKSHAAFGCILADRRLINTPVTTMERVSRISCFAQCLQQPRCESINYRPITRLCELNSQRINSTDELTDSVGTWFMATNVC